MGLGCTTLNLKAQVLGNVNFQQEQHFIREHMMRVDKPYHIYEPVWSHLAHRQEYDLRGIASSVYGDANIGFVKLESAMTSCCTKVGTLGGGA